MTLAPAAVSFDDQGKIYVEPTANLTKTVTKNLDRIGVKGSKRHATDEPEEVSCWPQLLPVTRDAATPQLSNQAPVLFELRDADDLPTLVTEMLRLGNDRQGFRWFAAPGDADSKRVLLARHRPAVLHAAPARSTRPPPGPRGGAARTSNARRGCGSRSGTRSRWRSQIPRRRQARRC